MDVQNICLLSRVLLHPYPYPYLNLVESNLLRITSLLLRFSIRLVEKNTRLTSFLRRVSVQIGCRKSPTGSEFTPPKF